MKEGASRRIGVKVSGEILCLPCTVREGFLPDDNSDISIRAAITDDCKCYVCGQPLVSAGNKYRKKYNNYRSIMRSYNSH